MDEPPFALVCGWRYPLLIIAKGGSFSTVSTLRLYSSTSIACGFLYEEKQSVPDGERSVVHIAVVCGFNRKFYKQRNSQQPVCDMQFTVVANESNRELRWQGASGRAHPVFCFVLNLLTHGPQPHSTEEYRSFFPKNKLPRNPSLCVRISGKLSKKKKMKDRK